MQIDTSKRVSIPLSKGKIVLLVICAIGFVVGSIWLYTISDSQLRYYPIVVKLVSILSIIFFCLCSVYGISKLFDNKPGLILDSDGIHDNSSGVSAGFVPWSEIVRIDITPIKSQKFLTFMVVDPSKYVDRGKYLKRKMNAANLKLFGSPIQISSNSLKIDFQELTDIVTQYYDQYRVKT